MLCQKTIARTDYLYRHLQGSAQFLDWEHRWRGLQVELPTFDADILGLQEVQADHFVEHFQPLMKKCMGFILFFRKNCRNWKKKLEKFKKILRNKYLQL